MSPGWIFLLFSLVARDAVADTESEPATVEPAQQPQDVSPDAEGEEEGGDRSYLVPAAEVVAINLAVNAFGRWGLKEDYSEVTSETMSSRSARPPCR